MQLTIDVPDVPLRQQWQRIVERHCDLTLRPFGSHLRRVNVHLEERRGHDDRAQVTCELFAYTAHRHIVVVCMQHAEAQSAIAIAFARAKRDLVRRLSRSRLSQRR